MKIIFNKPKKKETNEEKNSSVIVDIKKKTNNVINKIKNNDSKLSYKHYTLLILMIAIGVLSLRLNITENNKIDEEDYTSFGKKENPLETNTQKVAVYDEYETAISSISINISNEKEERKNIPKGTYIMPVEGKIIKEYSEDKLILSNTLNMWMTHEGIDIEAGIGTEVLAIAKGEIESVYEDALYGTTVIINHEGGYTSVYSNLQGNIDFKPKNVVKQGQVIGYIGNSAIIEVQDEPHIHLEILKDGINIDPRSIGLK